MGNITKAILCKARVCRTAPLYQYDYGQKDKRLGIGFGIQFKKGRMYKHQIMMVLV